MKTTELKKIKAAIKGVTTSDDTLFLQGNQFSCRWDGEKFRWTTPAGETFTATTKEVMRYIGNGNYITNYCFSYGD